MQKRTKVAIPSGKTRRSSPKKSPAARAPTARGLSVPKPNKRPSKTKPKPAKAPRTTTASKHKRIGGSPDTATLGSSLVPPISVAGVSLARFVNENQLDQFVRAQSDKAQRVIVELVYRLVAASVPDARRCRFPLGDSVNQPGPDGEVESDDAYASFVPAGVSYWEIGAGLSPRDKAASDYKERAEATPADVRRTSTFVFVTPLSGRRSHFAGTWEEGQQFNWLKKKRAEAKWRDVVGIDGTQMVSWLLRFPAVDRWLAQQITGTGIKHTTTPDLEWMDIRPIGQPPPLGTDLFLVGRNAARERLEQVFKRDVAELRIETHAPLDMVRFVAAAVASLPEAEQIRLLGRCLIVLPRIALKDD